MRTSGAKASTLPGECLHIWPVVMNFALYPIRAAPMIVNEAALLLLLEPGNDRLGVEYYISMLPYPGS